LSSFSRFLSHIACIVAFELAIYSHMTLMCTLSSLLPRLDALTKIITKKCILYVGMV
jgi:hypothetical protein